VSAEPFCASWATCGFRREAAEDRDPRELLEELKEDLETILVGLILGLLLGVSLCKYAAYSMFLTIKLQRKGDKEPTEEEKKAATEKGLIVPAAVKSPRLTWSVL